MKNLTIRIGVAIVLLSVIGGCAPSGSQLVLIPAKDLPPGWTLVPERMMFPNLLFPTWRKNPQVFRGHEELKHCYGNRPTAPKEEWASVYLKDQWGGPEVLVVASIFATPVAARAEYAWALREQEIYGGNDLRLLGFSRLRANTILRMSVLFPSKDPAYLSSDREAFVRYFNSVTVPPEETVIPYFLTVPPDEAAP